MSSLGDSYRNDSLDADADHVSFQLGNQALSDGNDSGDDLNGLPKTYDGDGFGDFNPTKVTPASTPSSQRAPAAGFSWSKLARALSAVFPFFESMGRPAGDISALEQPYGIDRTQMNLQTPEMRRAVYNRLGAPIKSGFVSVGLSGVAMWDYFRMTMPLRPIFTWSTSIANFFFHFVCVVETLTAFINAFATLNAIRKQWWGNIKRTAQQGDRALAVGLFTEGTLLFTVIKLPLFLYSLAASIAAAMLYIQALIGNPDGSSPSKTQITAGMLMMGICALINTGATLGLVNSLSNMIRDSLILPLFNGLASLCGTSHFMQEVETRKRYTDLLMQIMEDMALLGELEHENPLNFDATSKEGRALVRMSFLMNHAAVTRVLNGLEDADSANVETLLRALYIASQSFANQPGLAVEGGNAEAAHTRIKRFFEYLGSKFTSKNVGKLVAAFFAYMFTTGALVSTLVALGIGVQYILSDAVPFIANLLKAYAELPETPQAITTLLLVLPLTCLLYNVFAKSFGRFAKEGKHIGRCFVNVFAPASPAEQNEFPRLRRLGYFVQALTPTAIGLFLIFSLGASIRGSQDSIDFALMGDKAPLHNGILNTITTWGDSFLMTLLTDLGLNGLQDFLDPDGTLKFRLLALFIGFLGMESNIGQTIGTKHEARVALSTGVELVPGQIPAPETHARNIYLTARQGLAALQLVESLWNSDLYAINHELMRVARTERSRHGYERIAADGAEANLAQLPAIQGQVTPLTTAMKDALLLGGAAFRAHQQQRAQAERDFDV